MRLLGEARRERSGTRFAMPKIRAGDVVIAGITLGFLVLAREAQRHAFFAADLEITRALQAIHGAWMVGPLGVLSAIGFPPIVDVVYGLIALMLFVVGWRREGIACGAVAGSSAALNFVAKAIVARPRPSPELVRVAHDIPGTSFPAGHVLNATAFLGFLCYLAWVEMKPSWRRAGIVTLLMTAIAGMGLARIYFGEHWPSDVLGGYMLGGIWLYVCIRVYAWLRTAEIEVGPLGRRA